MGPKECDSPASDGDKNHRQSWSMMVVVGLRSLTRRCPPQLVGDTTLRRLLVIAVFTVVVTMVGGYTAFAAPSVSPPAQAATGQ